MPEPGEATTFYKGKYKTLEEFEKAHEAAEKAMHDSTTQFKTQGEQMQDMTKFVAYLEQVLEEQFGAMIDEEGNIVPTDGGEFGLEDDDGDPDGEQPLTLSQLQQVLPELLQPMIGPVHQASVGGIVDNTLTNYFIDNPDARKHHRELRAAMIDLAQTGQDVTDMEYVDELAGMAEYRANRIAARNGDGEGDGGEGDKGGRKGAPAMDFGGTGRRSSSRKIDVPTLTAEERVYAKGLEVPEDKFVEQKKEIAPVEDGEGGEE